MVEGQRKLNKVNDAREITEVIGTKERGCPSEGSGIKDKGS